MAWKNWEPIEVKAGGANKTIQGAPAVVCRGNTNLDIFVLDDKKNIYHGKYEKKLEKAAPTWKEPLNFVQWVELAAQRPSTTLTSLTATSWDEKRIDLFAVGDDKKVYHLAWNGSAWDAKWDVVPDTDNGKTGWAPAAASWAKDRMDVFIRLAVNNQMYNQHFEKQWSKWSNTGGPMKSLDSAPAAAASGLKRIDCFALEFNDKKHLLHSWYDGTSHDWARPGEAGPALDETQEIAGAPAAASSPLGTGRVDVFARSSKKRLIHREFMKDRWNGKWEELGNDEITGDPAAVSWWEGSALKRLDCFALGTSGMLKHTWWT